MSRTLTTEAQREQLLRQRDELRKRATKLQGRIVSAYGADRQRLIAEKTELDKTLKKLNEQVKEAHAAVIVPRDTWARVARAAEEYLYGEGDEDEAAEELEQALQAIAEFDPHWRQR